MIGGVPLARQRSLPRDGPVSRGRRLGVRAMARTAPSVVGLGSGGMPHSRPSQEFVAHDGSGTYLERLGHQFAAAVRTVVAICAAVLAPFAGPPTGTAVVAAVSALLIGWNLVYLAQMLRRPRTWCWGIDVGIVLALCLTQRWLVDPDYLARTTGWVLVVASFTVVAVQWFLPALKSACITVLIVGAYVVGAALLPDFGVVEALGGGGGAWMAVEGALARLMWHLVRGGGREADRTLTRRLSLERDGRVAAARRAAQRAHWATVHDTAATTLLMVGVGGVRGDEAWLGRQLRRDLAALTGPVTPGAGMIDLLDRLEATASASQVSVSLPLVGTLRVPHAVAEAFAGAVGESLENVRRHAGTQDADVSVASVGETVVVTVSDQGKGFDPAAVLPHRHGLRTSVHGRMIDVGGTARVASVPGSGTMIQLEWRNG